MYYEQGKNVIAESQFDYRVFVVLCFINMALTFRSSMGSLYILYEVLIRTLFSESTMRGFPPSTISASLALLS